MATGNLVGQTLGQYELRELLGAGGMGSVYRAYQANLKRAVAVKVLAGNLASQIGAGERFNQEAEIAAALEHPNIVPILDYGIQGTISYVVMRLLSGGALNDRIHQRLQQQAPQPSLNEISHLLSQLASALDYAHSHGVIHRDIKPSNVMFDNHGNAYIVDFGIAKILEGAAAITGTGATMGTPAYMSPEQWKSEPLSAAADQYALAVMAYELITGRVPFEAATPYALMNKHLNEKVTPAHAVRLDVPEAVNLVLERALSKEPEKRFPSVTGFAQSFESAIRGFESKETGFFTYQLQAIRAADQARDIDGDTKISRPNLGLAEDRKQTWLPLVMAGGVLLLAILGGLFLFGGEGDKASKEIAGSETEELASTESVEQANAAPPDTPIPTLDPLIVAVEGAQVTFEDQFNEAGISSTSWSATGQFPANDGIGIIEGGSVDRYITPGNGFVTLFRYTAGNLKIALAGGPGPSFWSLTLQQLEDETWEFELGQEGDIASVGSVELQEAVWYYYLVRMVGGNTLEVRLWERDQPEQFIVKEDFRNNLIGSTYLFHTTLSAEEGAFEVALYKELLFAESYGMPEVPPRAPMLVVGAESVTAYAEPYEASAQKALLSGQELALLGTTRAGDWLLASDGSDQFWVPRREHITGITHPFLHIPVVLEVAAQPAPVIFPAGVQVLMHEDFADGTSLAAWNVTLPENIEIAHSYATINGGAGPNNPALWRDALDASQGFLILFKYQPGAIEISLFSNSETDGSFYGYILQYHRDDIWRVLKRPGQGGRSTAYYGEYPLVTGKWYYLLMRVDKHSNAAIQLWEPDSSEYLINQWIAGDGTERRWVSFFNVPLESVLVLDHYSEVAFPLDYETPLLPPVSLEGTPEP